MVIIDVVWIENDYRLVLLQLWVRIGIERETSCVLERVYHKMSSENEKVGKMWFLDVNEGMCDEKGSCCEVSMNGWKRKQNTEGNGKWEMGNGYVIVEQILRIRILWNYFDYSVH